MVEQPTSNVQPQNNVQFQRTNVQKFDTKPPVKKVYDIRERLLIFGQLAIKISRELPKTIEMDVIRRQLTRSGTAVGANFEEADGAVTRRDFINKANIAKKEAKETKYWLRIISGASSHDVSQAIVEAEEIIKILSAMIIKSGIRNRKQN